MSSMHDRNRSSWVRKYGINLDVDGAEDIIAAGGDQYWPAAVVAAADIDIVSSSAADAAAGTGARTIFIDGLDANGYMQSETVTLNGLTDVHPTKDYLRIHRVIVLTVGSGGDNAGVIQIDDGAGNVLASIPVGYGQTQQAAYTIPKNWSYGWVRDFHVHLVGSSTPSTDTAQGFLMARDAAGQSWRVIENWTVSRDKKGGSHPPDQWPGIRLPAGADIRLRVTAVSSVDEIIAGTIFIELE